MVCKEDVISWFKELESYKRIDTMCTLLNMCLPFELRFIGTCLEELGKRDFQELRGAELRANNPTDLAADIGGANTDPRTRRKMALYVSLLRSCNYVCATTLYNVMVGLEQTGLLSGLYGDPLEELLLLYTMALHHPAFTFDQRSHFGQILDQLTLEDQRSTYLNPPVHSHSLPPPSSSCVTHTSITTNLIPHPNVTGLGPPQNILYMKSPQMPVTVHGQELLPDGNTIITDMSAPPGIPLPHYDYVVGHNIWAGLLPSPMNPPLEALNYPTPSSPPTTSPLSSPGGSRASSPRPGRPGPPPGPPPGRPRPPAFRQPPPPPLLPPHLRLGQPHPTPAMLAHNLNAALNIGEMRAADEERRRELRKLNGLRAGGRRSSGSDSSGPPSPAPRLPNGSPPAPPASAPPAPPAPSCYNCGLGGHAGARCPDPSMEEVTRAGGYRLRYGGPRDDHDSK